MGEEWLKWLNTKVILFSLAYGWGMWGITKHWSY